MRQRGIPMYPYENRSKNQSTAWHVARAAACKFTSEVPSRNRAGCAGRPRRIWAAEGPPQIDRPWRTGPPSQYEPRPAQDPRKARRGRLPQLAADFSARQDGLEAELEGHDEGAKRSLRAMEQQFLRIKVNQSTAI